MAQRKKKPLPEAAPAACAVDGCAAPGAYKAPRSRADVRDYQWLCLEHVREFNRAWDYFKDMTAEQIEWFIQDAVHGHRPTWQRDNHAAQHMHTEQLHEALHRFFHEEDHRFASKTRQNARERQALAALELDEPCEADALKRQYRVMVKRFHPDLHRGDRHYEEKFKQITAAYAYLLQLYQPHAS